MKQSYKVLLVALTGAWLLTANAADSRMLDAFRKMYPTAVSYSHDDSPPSGVKDLYIFYDKNGTALGGAAVRYVKTYGRFIGVLMLANSEDATKVRAVWFPEIHKVRKQSERQTIIKAVRRVEGRVVKKGDDKKRIDAVSGATRYHRQLYLNLNKMSSILIDEMSEENELKRTPLHQGK